MARQRVPLGPYSDGDVTKRPTQPPYTVCTSDIYLTKVADLWMVSHPDGIPGNKYVLENLPAGYELFEKPRNNPTSGVRTDRYLWGHPSGKAFDSPNQFYPHFKFLMDHNDETPRTCDCRLCDPGPRRSTGATNGTTRASTRSGNRVSKLLYEEKKTNFFDLLFEQIRQLPAGTPSAERFIRDNQRFDLEVPTREQKDLLAALTRQPSYIPRKGEIVLWYRDELKGEVDLEPTTGHFKEYNSRLNKYLSFPVWEAGVVTETPLEEPVLEDIVTDVHRTTNVNAHGYRIEAYPDPDEEGEKGYSSQYKYVPLHRIRPFCFWGEYMTGYTGGLSTYHPTVWNGVRALNTISVVDKFKATYSKDHATIGCGGVWLGSEIITIGDAVRILPERPPDYPGPEMKPTRVLVVTEITMELTGIGGVATFDLGVTFSGREFTISTADATSPQLSDEWAMQNLPPAMWGYTWYETGDPSVTVSHAIEKVLGRVYEPAANVLWLTEVRLIHGWKGVWWGRDFASRPRNRVDERLPWKEFVWSEDRVEGLGLDANSIIGASRPAEDFGRVFLKRMCDRIDPAPGVPSRMPGTGPVAVETLLAVEGEEDDDDDVDEEGGELVADQPSPQTYHYPEPPSHPNVGSGYDAANPPRRAAIMSGSSRAPGSGVEAPIEVSSAEPSERGAVRIGPTRPSDPAVFRARAREIFSVGEDRGSPDSSVRPPKRSADDDDGPAGSPYGGPSSRRRTDH